MPSTNYRPPSGWGKKFDNAFRGVARGMRGQSSFVVHAVMTVLVLLVGTVLALSRFEWCLIVLCIAAVLTAELFNSSLETMARSIDRSENNQLGEALDVASGAVLISAFGAAIIGVIIFGPHLWMWIAR